MTRSEAIAALKEDYTRQRREDEAALDRRIRDAETRDPEIARLRAESIALTGEALRAMMAAPTKEEKQRIADRMKAEGKAHNAAIRLRAKGLGLGDDAFEVQYRCPLCRDTGLVGDAPARFCECFESRLRAMLLEDGGMRGGQRFETFDIDIFPEADGQRNAMRKIRTACEQYADSFPDTPVNNLLMTGPGGLGKTFLLNCIYQRVVERGGSAVRITAFRMQEAMRLKHMNIADPENSFDLMLNAPLLLIDDLGSEPMMKNITIEYLFLLLNERMSRDMHTVICTNLSPAQLGTRYGERVSSRLLDRRAWLGIPFSGKDLRSL